eukprot:CAMPEP_0117033968 /NCGR_PEP_ID=MMETSP0472-20121206/24234_1 /TAXON_ID=693140 ORGANISM="Tiarina fusus, Strain LIS" /NCGR_SAMPLE_ID=MMETSP0472 /ASSEMBLY_ACC=CAM_ASM_000603 /LENGTH=356 /DNA_ID=CAMNT_0004743039 /DNA_START=99 /DNA_END=1166 /DNA_ORIENTATION=-
MTNASSSQQRKDNLRRPEDMTIDINDFDLGGRLLQVSATPPSQQNDEENSWIQSFIRNHIDENDEDDQISITDEFLMPQEHPEPLHQQSTSTSTAMEEEDEQSLLEVFAASFNSAEVQHEEEHEASFSCENFNIYKNNHYFRDSVSTDGEPFGIVSYSSNTTTTTSSSIHDHHLNDSISSLNEAFEQLNKCMDRTSRTREMLRQAGLVCGSNSDSSLEPPGGTATTSSFQNSSPNIVTGRRGGDLDTHSNHETSSGTTSIEQCRVSLDHTVGGGGGGGCGTISRRNSAASLQDIRSSSWGHDSLDSIGSTSTARALLSSVSSSNKIHKKSNSLMKRSGIAPRRVRANATTLLASTP